MSYCRGIIYVVRAPSDSGSRLSCFSALHSMSQNFETDDERAMIHHLEGHKEDAEEILASIHKATERLKGEIAKRAD